MMSIGEREIATENSFLTSELLKGENVFHFFSTKTGWNGNARFTGDHPDIYSSHRKQLAHFFNMDEECFVFPRQVHGDKIELVSQVPETVDIAETDALITNKKGICICVQTADCVPILIYDPVKNVSAAVHAGWRGTVKKIVSKTIRQMNQQFGCNPSDLIAVIGPSISPGVYE